MLERTFKYILKKGLNVYDEIKDYPFPEIELINANSVSDSNHSISIKEGGHKEPSSQFVLKKTTIVGLLFFFSLLIFQLNFHLI